jgi:hypothetical protein
MVLSLWVEPNSDARYHFSFVVRGRFLRLFGGVGLALCACAFWVAPAAAAGDSPQNSGVYDQYTEQVPTAGGSHGTGSGGGSGSGPTSSGGGGIILPSNLEKDGGKDAKTLREIATSPQFGAPNSTVPLPEGSTNGSVGLSSAVGAVTDGSEGRMVGLFVALLAVTAVSLGFAASRRRNV